MSIRAAWNGSLFVLLQLLAYGPMAAQGARAGASLIPHARDAAPLARVQLEGIVLAPDGSPAYRAVVASSAGGRAVTDAAGSYCLEVDVPLDATSVELTAIGGTGGSLVARTSVAVSATSGRIRVQALGLGRGSSLSWIPTFGVQPGTNADVLAFAQYDDGNGPALYAAGAFSSANGVAASRIARWDGGSWSALGSGTNGSVRALTVHDDGSGPALFAGGTFTTAGGAAANRIARWNGSSWSALAGGVSGDVLALAVYDDGNGPALFVGGGFTSVGGVPASYIAKWDGSSWSALGSGPNDGVNALAVYDDGAGPDLYVVGDFREAGGVAARKIARWDGASWSAVGSRGFHDSEDRVHALVVYDDGGGPDLYAAGEFFGVGNVAVDDVARWNGTTWSALGSGIDEDHASVHALGVFDAGSGPALHVGGAFTTAGGVGASAVAKWDGASWSALGGGLAGDVRALARYDDGGGAALYAAGAYFTTRTAGGGPAHRIARWDGASWSALGSGVNDDVMALAVHDDGSGPALYAAGSFTVAGGVPASSIARWNGTSWSALGTGLRGFVPFVHALAVYDDGSGPALFAAGYFTTAGGVPANRIAKWDGRSWSALGGGVDGNFPVISALAVYKDDDGLALYAAGRFASAGGVAASNIAKWNGARWSALGSGIGPGTVGTVHALVTHDDGRGPALYAGGSFSVAGGVPTIGIARWDGTSWSALGSGASSTVHSLAVHDDGRGPALFVGGSFVSAGSVAAQRIARWDGTSWSALGSGVGGLAFESPSVLALASHDDGKGPALYAGGDFTVALDSGDSFLAKWGSGDTTAPVLACPSSVTVLDRMGDGPGEVVRFTVTATDELDPAAVVECVPPSGSTFPLGTTWVECTATDASGNRSSRQFPVTVAPRGRQR